MGHKCDVEVAFPFSLQDVGGQDKIRPLWRHYYTGTQVNQQQTLLLKLDKIHFFLGRASYLWWIAQIGTGLMRHGKSCTGGQNYLTFFFLIQSCKFFKAPVTKVPKACTSVSAISLIFRIINDREMRDAIILIFANKQDLPEGETFLTYFGSSVCFEKKLSPRNHTIFHD